MKILGALISVFLAQPAVALKLEFLAQAILPTKMDFKNTKVGGLSALWFEKESNSLYAVSDDRGSVNEPRFYKFHFDFKKGELVVAGEDVFFIHKKNSEGNVKKRNSSQNSVLDMEGMAILPWGNFLISSKGDNNRKPRAAPEILDVKKDGTWVRSFDIPTKFIPESTGEQHKGIRNNTGIEGLTAWSDKNLIWAWTEGPLVQDSEEGAGPIRVLQYEMPEAWVLKPTKEFLYQPDAKLAKNKGVVLASLVSEAMALSDTEFLVLERAVEIGPKSLGFNCRIYKASIAAAEDVSKIESLKGQDLTKMKKISKSLVLDLADIREKLGGSVDNFEGMSFGPEIDGKKTIILVSDDNFKRILKTQFVLFKLIE